MRHPTFRWWLLLAVVAGLWTANPTRCVAVEEAQAFLDGLRERGYYDSALDYLEQMRTSPLCPPEWKSSLDYQAAITLMSSSLIVQDPKLRERTLDEARDKFEGFIKANPNSPQVPAARMQLANVLVERGRFKMEQSERPTKSPEEKAALRAEARKLYQDAQKVFTEAELYFTKEHAKYPKVIDPKKTKEIEEREEVRKNLVNSRLLLASVAYEIAKTYDPKSKEYKDAMLAAAKKYNELYMKYKAFLSGLYARMWEGRCYKDLGDKESLKKAQTIFEEMLMQPDQPQAFRDMKNKSLVFLMETLSLPELKNYAAILERGATWEDSANPNEESSVDGLAIHFLEGEAAFELMKANKEKESKEYREMRTAARKHFNLVGRFDGQYQQQARARMRDPLLASVDDTTDPKDFSEARDMGKAALDEMQAVDFEIKLKQSQGQLTAKLTQEFNDRKAVARDEAIKYFHKALELAATEPMSDELRNEMNVVRYYLAYLYWSADELYEAAVMGEFLARKYPNSAGARPGAKIALATYVKLRSQMAKDADRSFETRRMSEIAKYITDRWPGGAEAEEAWLTLIRVAIADRDVAKAKEYLAQLPEDSSRRAEAELLVGQATWIAYIQGAFLPEEERPAPEKLAALSKEAQQLLESGVARMQKAEADKGELSYTMLSSVLSLAQIYVDANEPKKAIEKLEDPTFGPLTLVTANNPLTDHGNFRTETYKVALRAYVADQQLDKAEKTMDALEKLMGAGADAGASNKLTQIYISLGLELEKQVQRLTKENNPTALKAVLDGFKLFLTRISERPGNSFNSLHWVAETFYSLGAGLDPGTRTLPADVRNYYEKAAETYRKILEEVEAGTLEAPPRADISIKIRLVPLPPPTGRVLRGQGHAGQDPHEAQHDGRRAGGSGLYLPGLGRRGRQGEVLPVRHLRRRQGADPRRQRRVPGVGLGQTCPARPAEPRPPQYLPRGPLQPGPVPLRVCQDHLQRLRAKGRGGEGPAGHRDHQQDVSRHGRRGVVRQVQRPVQEDPETDRHRRRQELAGTPAGRRRCEDRRQVIPRQNQQAIRFRKAEGDFHEDSMRDAGNPRLAGRRHGRPGVRHRQAESHRDRRRRRQSDLAHRGHRQPGSGAQEGAGQRNRLDHLRR